MNKFGPDMDSYDYKLSVKQIDNQWAVFRGNSKLCDPHGYPTNFQTKEDAQSYMIYLMGVYGYRTQDN